MNLNSPIRALLFFAALSAAAQSPVPQPAAAPAAIKPKKPRIAKPSKSDAPTYNTNLIVLDAAHGGADAGAKLGDNSFEKDATVALAAQIKPRLEAKGFTVFLTHNAAAEDTPQDARIELANRNHPVACLLLHASNGGHGVHLYTSALAPNHPSLTPGEPSEIIPWDTAQASVLPQSLRLSNDLATAVNGSRIPLVAGQSSVRPMDSLTCPVVALELAPLGSTPASDAGYQAQVADAVAQALVFWRGHVVSLTAAAAAAKAMSTPNAPATPDAAKPAPKPKPKPIPKPVKIPDEEPLETAPAPQSKPAAPRPGVPQSPPEAALLFPQRDPRGAR